MRVAQFVVKWVGVAAVSAAFGTATGDARAFPGICVGKDTAARSVRATQIVLLRNGPISVVTVMADYQGPLAPFAFVLPVPADVVRDRVRTVKAGLVQRLEELSAPRFHPFYEQDPCVSGPPEQDWDEHVRAPGGGFLSSPDLPPLAPPYALPNLIAAPVAPVFKASEDEFRYTLVEPGTPQALGAWLAERGYRVSEAQQSALAPQIGAGKKLLFAEVASLDHVELIGPDHVQLGGIRYWSTRSLDSFPETLGLQNSAATQDLTIYVLDRQQRFRASNYDSVFVPDNLEFDARAADRIGPIYNALFEALRSRHPQAFVSEFAWSTAGCGQPCPDAPLGLDELMTFGADVVEAHATRPGAVPLAAAPESTQARQRFEHWLSELPPGRQGAARRDHAQALLELARRRALLARHSYVLSRLHYRYTRASLARDVELGPAPPVAAGVGIPAGQFGELSHDAVPAKQNQLQVRFVALQPWRAEIHCSTRFRYHWGTRWASQARASRRVPVALDLALAPAAPELLSAVLLGDLPELGIRARAEALKVSDASSPRPGPARSRPPDTPHRSVLCSASMPGAPPVGTGRALALALLWLWLARRFMARRVSLDGARCRARLSQ